MSRHLKHMYGQLIVLKRTSTITPARFYARWTKRTPAKVLLPFEPTANPSLKKEKVISLDPTLFTGSKNKNISGPNNQSSPKEQIEESVSKGSSTLSPEKSKQIKTQREEKLKQRIFYQNQKKVFDDNNEIIYEKLKDNDGRISSLLVKLKSKKERLRSRQVLVEGWRLIVDGLEAKCKLNYVIFSRTEDLNNLRPFLPKSGVQLYKIPYKEIGMWSNVETSPGVFGVFQMPTADNVRSLSRPLPMNFICDNIRVPGNLGAILRVAVGAGCEKVLLTKGCVDLWDSKVIRSAAGAHFRLPIHSSVEWEDIPKLLESNTSIFIADSNAKAIIDDDGVQLEDLQQDDNVPVMPYYGVQFTDVDHITLILGGETEGISENSYRLAARRNGLRLNIPLQRGIDSLNTGMAAAVIAFEIRKQLIQAWTKAKLQRQNAQAT